METRKKKSFKRLFAFLMAFVMVTTLAVSAVFAADPTFKDVPKDYEFYDEIEDLAAKKIVSGYGTTGLFKPEEKLTRAQAAKMIAKAAGITVSKGFKSSFTDVDEDVDMYEHIWALEEAEIVKGWGTTKEFRPDEAIERGHVAKMIARAFGVVEGNTKVEFKDLPADKDVADAIMALASNDIVKGYGTTGEFRPEEPVLRGQFAKMVSRAMGLEVLEVRATNSKTVRVKFNRTIKGLKAVDFTIYEKDKDAIKFAVEKVKTDDEVYFLTLFGELEEDVTYVLEVKGVEGKFEFEYVEGTPTTLKFLRTTYKLPADTEVEYALLDENDNDISIDYLDDLVWASSKTDIVKLTGKIGNVAGVAVVNLSLVDDANKVVLTTGNKNITVLEEDEQVYSGIGTFKLTKTSTDYSFKTPPALTQEMFKKDNQYFLRAEFLDQDGEQMVGAPTAITYRTTAETSTIAQVEELTGKITPIKVGTVQIVVTAKYGTKTLSKSFAVPIKADPKATSLKLTTNDSDLVLGSNIYKPYKIEVLDQYGEVFVDGDPTIKFVATINKNGVVKDWFVPVAPNTYSHELGIIDGKYENTFKPLDADKEPASGVITITYGGNPAIQTKYTLKSVKAATFSKYVVVPSATTLDRVNPIRPLTDPRYMGPRSATVVVFAEDVNGNYIRKVEFGDSGVEFASLVKVSTAPLAELINVGGDQVDIADMNPAARIGKQSVKVLVKGENVDAPVLIDTIEFTVVNSYETLTSVVQTVNSVEANALTLADKLYSKKLSSDPDVFSKAAFLGYDQYGDRIDINGATKIWSSNNSVIQTNTTGTLNVVGVGKANVTLEIADQLFNIDIKIG